ARPEQGDLIARLVAESSAGVYAAQSYIAAFGEPSLATGLQGHRFIPFGDPARMTAVMKGYGVELTAENFVHDTASGPVAWAMAREGLGLCLMSRHLGDQSPSMVRVLRDTPPLSFPIWLVTHRELHTSAKIRLVYDALADSILRTFVVADAGNESDHAD
ncbi:MAG: LysR substrate-binding domain-containing protein, partial [Pseudomonadota bacterium]|nr:LysR substrate-binding domain-containing protein [Pseudomonadota bacterium]